MEAVRERIAALADRALRGVGRVVGAPARRGGGGARKCPRRAGATARWGPRSAAPPSVMDIGRSVDFFDRHEHAARIVLATEVFGFSHREIALTAAVIAAAGDEDEVGKALSPARAEGRPRRRVEAAGVILALADDIVERCPPERRGDRRCRGGTGGLRGHRPRSRRLAPRARSTPDSSACSACRSPCARAAT